jgi:hypothetical protein
MAYVGNGQVLAGITFQGKDQARSQASSFKGRFNI